MTKRKHASTPAWRRKPASHPAGGRSKFGRICLHRICDLNRIDIVVSDASLPPAMRAALAQQGVQVLIAEEE
jgi:hypothetical protein